MVKEYKLTGNIYSEGQTTYMGPRYNPTHEWVGQMWFNIKECRYDVFDRDGRLVYTVDFDGEGLTDVQAEAEEGGEL